MSVYSFFEGPSYTPMTPQDAWDSALSQPYAFGTNLLEQGRGGVLESFGLGTAIRDTFIPSGNTEGGMGRLGVAAIPGVGPVYEGFRALVQSQVNEDQPSMSEDEYKSSAWYRPNIPFEAGMTKQRAEALATWDDARRVREHFSQKRPISSFIGNLGGQALDPINYVPVFGNAVKAAAVAKAGRVAGTALVAAGDAAANTALAALPTMEARGAYGDDVSWQATVSQIATAALIGGAFGGIGGALGKAVDARSKSQAVDSLGTLKTVQEARIALNEGIDAIVRGEDIQLSPNATEPMARVASEFPVEGRDVPGMVPVVERPEFKNWFAGSKVVDENGNPLVVYHGTGANFDAFDPSSAGQSTDAGKLGVGFYFSARPDIASFYAERSRISRDSGPNVMPVYVALKNPLEFDAAKPGSIQDKLREKSQEWGIELDPVQPDGGNTPNDAWAYAFTEVAKEKGHDGVILKFSDGGHELVAFEPGQIKSRFNTGAFSKSDPRIIDTSPARPDPLPEGRAQAEARVAKPENYKQIAETYRVDPETGDFPELADIAQIEKEGRLTEADMAALETAKLGQENGVAYGEALKAVVGCLL